MSYLDELYHHGIIGQHWHVKHGPPYPLDKKTSGRIKSAGQSTKYTRRRSQLKRGATRTADDNQGMSAFLSNRDNEYTDYHERTWPSGNSAPFDLKKLIGDFKKEANIFPPELKLDHDITKSDGSLNLKDLSTINYGFGEDNDDWHYGRTNNCMKCTAALALKKKGFDVAAGSCMDGINKNAFSYWFDGAYNYETDSASVDTELASQGVGAFGKVGISYSGKSDDGSTIRTGGHAVFYQVEPDGVKYYDGQTKEPQKFSTYKELNDANGADSTFSASICRLDTAQPNWDHLAEDSVVVPGKEFRAHNFTRGPKHFNAYPNETISGNKQYLLRQPKYNHYTDTYDPGEIRRYNNR